MSVSVAEASYTALHNAAHLYCNWANPLAPYGVPVETQTCDVRLGSHASYPLGHHVGSLILAMATMGLVNNDW